MTEPRFIHLRIRSDYSIVDGLAKIETLVKKAVTLGMPALAITDFTNLCGFVKFCNIARSVGLKQIIGSDFHVRNELFGEEMMHLTILAMNNTGYKNLIFLISKAYQYGYSEKGPWINLDWLREKNEGLLLLSGGRRGDIGASLLRGESEKAIRCLDFYQEYFPDRFYIELIRTGRPKEEKCIHFSVAFAEKYGIPVVATNDVRFIDEEDFDAHEIRVAIHDGFTLDDPKRPRNYSSQQYMRNEEEMCELFSDIPEALINSVEISKRCNVFIRFGEYCLPKFPTGEMSTEDFLIKKSKEGLEKRLIFLFPDEKKRKEHRLKYEKRLDSELRIINQMGFPGYFLIVMEFIQWSKDNGVPVGPGRGSGASSLVAYSLKITDIDPLSFDLLFERFLNPERISMPDFDIDFCMEKRDKVIEHVSQMYGCEAVAQIIAFGTMAAKAAIRDVGRVLGYPYSFVDRISKLVPLDPGITLLQAFEMEPQLSIIYDRDEEVRMLIDMARKLEGVTRNASKHAGGVVIAPTKITDFSPLYCDGDRKHPLTQFDKNDVEEVGLVKFDFLGLRTLTIIDFAVEIINKRRKKNGEPLLDISSIPFNDKDSFELLRNAETTAVFQLESRGMRELIKRLQPDCFEDMIALVALFRPGPLQSGMVDNFINRKHGREKISYPDAKWQHESLKSVLAPTYGIILYQEQVMQIAQVLSGYSLGEADVLRRAIGKKKQKEMEKQRSIFENGARKNGISGDLAIKIFNLVEKFSNYGFNKAHSTAYALISYQTLWLKAHYPAEFIAAVMSSDMDNTEKIVGLVEECRRLGLKILPPDINSGMYYFHVNEKNEIVYGIGAIKGIGASQVETILNARRIGGFFRDLFDFCSRTGTKKLNRRVLEKLIMSGALDCFGSHRAVLINSLSNALKAASQHAEAELIGQSDMFGVSTKETNKTNQLYIPCKPLEEEVVLNGERETLGLYLTGHPINRYLKEIQHYVHGTRLKDIRTTERGKLTTVAGLTISTKIIVTKRSNRIGICTLDDSTGRLDVMLFADTLDKYRKFLEKDRVLIVSGRITFDDFIGELKMTAHEIMDINTARRKYVRGLAISLKEEQNNEKLLRQLRQLLKPYCTGNIPVYLYSHKDGANVRLRSDSAWFVSPSDQLLSDLRNLIGPEQIVLKFN